MKKTIVSYSYTGNNDAFALGLAREISADHIRILETGKRTMQKIILDTIFNRCPKIRLSEDRNINKNHVIFISPVWLGKIAAPMRTYLHQLDLEDIKFGFISISGGADGPDTNSEICNEITGILAKEPDFVLDLHKANLLPSEPKPSRKMTMNYRLQEGDVDLLIRQAMPTIKIFTN